MHLRDYLHDIPLRALKTIAANLGVTVEYPARIKLINAVDHAFWDGSLVERLLNSLSPEEAQLLSLVAFSYDFGIAEAALFRKAESQNTLDATGIRHILDRLIPLALVAGIRRNNGEETVYFTPKGVASQLRERLLGKIVDTPPRQRAGTPSGFPNLMEDITSFLALVYAEEIPVTLGGRVRKSALERAFDGSMTTTGDHRLSREFRNQFVNDYLVDRRLLDVTNRTAHTTSRLAGWLELSTTDRLRDIVSFSFGRVLHDDVLIIPVTGILAGLSEGMRVDPASLARFMYERTMATGGLQRIAARLRTMGNVLIHLGILAPAGKTWLMTGIGARLFRGEDLPMDDTISGLFTVQPNFEIIVGPELDPRVRFRLELLADRVNRDVILTYMISRESIVRARERGLSSEDILRFLDEHARNRMPQNVRFSIEGWAEEYGSIRFATAVLMRFRDIATANGATHLPGMERYIIERISDTAAVVHTEHIPAIADLLRKSGFHPQRHDDPPPDTAASCESYQPVPLWGAIDASQLPQIHTDFVSPDYPPETPEEP